MAKELIRLQCSCFSPPRPTDRPTAEGYEGKGMGEELEEERDINGEREMNREI